MLELPVPPSVNHCWRFTSRGVFKKSRYIHWLAESAIEANRQAFQGCTGPVSVAIQVIPGEGWNIMRDIDNVAKCTLDFLGSGGYISGDDCRTLQVLSISVGMPEPKACIRVTKKLRSRRWKPAPTSRWKMRQSVHSSQLWTNCERLPERLKAVARRWLNTLPDAVLHDTELDDTHRHHTIEEHVEELGDWVNTCEEWYIILAHVFPGLYGSRPVSEKAVMYYTDGSSARIKRYSRRAWQGVQVFNPGDGDGTQEAQDAQAKAAKHSPAHRQEEGRETERASARLLRELEACTAYALGARTTLPHVLKGEPIHIGK